LRDKPRRRAERPIHLTRRHGVSGCDGALDLRSGTAARIGRARPPSAHTTRTNPPPAGTGITVLGPVCPVQRADPPCTDRPVAAGLAVLDAETNSSVATVDSGADGHFRIALAAGRYLLRGVNVAGAPPHSPMLVSVVVRPGHYTTVTVRFDSGIR
jgi:hypothetical protein